MFEKNTAGVFYEGRIFSYIAPAAAGIIGILLVLLSTSRFGPGVSADSVAYMHAAKSLAEGKGFIYFGFNAPFIQWPPLYSSMLAFVGLFGVEIAAAANYLNAFILGLIIFLSGRWMTRNVKTKICILWGLGALTFSVPLVYISKYVWSEPLFILLVLLFIIKMGNYMQRQKRSYLFISAICAALACLTRYIGVVLILVGVIAVLLQRRKLLDKLYDMVVFGFVSAFPLGLWIVRNYVVSQTMFGARTPSTYTLKQNIILTIKTLLSWIVPYRKIIDGFGASGVKLLKIAAAVFCTALVVVFIVWLLRKKTWKFGVERAYDGSKRTYDSSKKIDDGGRRSYGNGEDTLISILIVPVLFVLIYIAYLIASATSVAFDSIDSRLLSPVFVPVILIISIILDRVTLFLKGQTKNKIISYIFAFAAVLLLICPALSTVDGIKFSMSNGAGGFNTNKWNNSSLIGLLRESSIDGQIYSNCPDAVYALTDKPASYTPRKNSLDIYGFEQFSKAVKDSKASYIVWFDKYPAGPNYGIEELAEHYYLKKITGTEEGSIFALHTK